MGKIPPGPRKRMVDKMTETVNIVAKSISNAWFQLLHYLYWSGTHHQPDYNTSTKRAHATVHIKNVHDEQHVDAMPFGPQALERYKSELTQEYAEWYISLPADDKRKFDYCYAKQLMMYGPEYFNTLRENIRYLREGSRRHVGVLWENDVHIRKFEDQPCWIAYKLEQVNDNDLILYILYRSWDIYGGFPANLPAIVYGIEKVLKEEGSPLKISELIATGWDAHYYSTDADAVRAVVVANAICGKCGKVMDKRQMILNGPTFKCAKCMGE